MYVATNLSWIGMLVTEIAYKELELYLSRSCLRNSGGQQRFQITETLTFFFSGFLLCTATNYK